MGGPQTLTQLHAALKFVFMTRTLTGIAAILGLASASFAAPSGKPETNPPPMAASLTGASDPAAAAKDQIIKDAVSELKEAQVGGGSEAYARPWNDMRWLASGSGKVGRLYDLCTGAVEPPPKLSVGTWSWETLDPRGLSPRDRRKLVEWQAQQVLAQYGCGTVFVIGTLSSDAHRALHACPARPGNGVGDVNAFVAYVHRRTALRSSDDLTGALVEALRMDGCS